MRPSLALSIGAVAATALGVPLALAPASMLSAFGLSAPDEALILSRDAGVLLIGLGIIDWMAARRSVRRCADCCGATSPSVSGRS
jgi:hypothetical protein